MTTDEGQVTRLLRDVEAGQEGAMDRLMEVVYEDLKGVAERHMQRRFGHDLAGVTMEPAALVNESFLRLLRQRENWANRKHFFAIATRVMLRVLVDYQRSRLAERRGGGLERITISLADPPAPDGRGTDTQIGIDALVAALDRLEALDPRKADVVKMKLVWGMEMKEIAGALGISLATVERDWSFAKAWLAREAAGGASPA
jgi:RNA polymerase sigma factor (TIGR02999 family)